MADGYISQIKTPDNKVYLLKDSQKTDEKVKQTSNTEDKEFPIILKNTNNTTNETAGVKYVGGVTVNPSDKTVTATEFIGKLNMGRLVPISTKTYNAPLYQSSGANFYQNFATVTPADYNAIWVAHYRITITAAGHSDYTEICDVSISGRNNTWYTYKIYNSIVNYSIYQHMLLNSNSATVPHELGYRMQGSYGADTVQKVVKVELLEQLNCTVTLLDNLKLYTSATPSGYTWRSFNATSNGLQEYGDTNETGIYIYSNGFKGKAGSNKVYKQCLFARTSDGTYESFVMQNDTVATTKTVNPHGFVPDGKIYWNSSNTVYSEGTLNLSAYQQYHVIDYRYSFNFNNTFLPDYCETYVVYTYNEDDGLLYLDTTQWLAAALPTTADGKIYQRIGSKYYTGTSNYYQGSLLLDNPYYEFKNGKIRTWAPSTRGIKSITRSGTTFTATRDDGSTFTFTQQDNAGITSVTIGATSPVQSSTSTAQTGSSASTTISLADAYGDTKNPYGSKTKNYVLAAPSNANGTPSFRALVAADIPSLSGTYLPLAGGNMTGDGGIQFPTTSGNNKANNWISAGGGYGTSSGKSGVKLISCEQSDVLMGLGADCGGGPYEMSIIVGENPSNTQQAFFRFLKHKQTSTTYTKLAEINGTGDFSAIGNIIGTKFHSNAVATDTDLTRIPAKTEIALETGNGNGAVSAWIWRENYASSNWGIFHNNSTDTLHVVGGSVSRLSIALGNGNVTIAGTVTATGFSGSGASLTNLPAGQLTGTISMDRIATGAIANGKLANSKVTIAGNDVSLGGSLAASTLVTSLGLSKAMRFIGVATVAITDGSTTDPIISGYSTKTAGDVIIDKDSSREYVWSTTGKWELLGGDESYWVSSIDTAAKFWRGDNKWSDTISGGTLKITNHDLTLEIGAQNSSWVHFTSGTNFYFNHQINAVDGFKVYNTTTSLTNNNLTFAQGGGWSMSDSTWIRTVGSKSVYMNAGTFRNDGTTQLRSLVHINANIVDDGSWVTGATGTAPTATTTDGTTTYSGATIGTSILTLGNNKVGANSASGVANNAQGYLRLYSSGSAYGELTAYTTSSKTHVHATNGISFPENTINIMFRPGSGSYYTHVSYQTAGNEALVSATQNAVTSFIFVNGESYANIASDRWTKLTGASGAGNAPGLQIKQNCVSIGELIPNGTNATYKLNVNGTSNFKGNMTSTGNFYTSGRHISLISGGETDQFIDFAYAADPTVSTAPGASWRIGALNSGSGDGNYFVIQTGGSATNATTWNNALRLGMNTYDAGFGGNVYPLTNNSKTLGTSSLKWNNVYATTFTGNLTGNATSADSAKWFMNRGGSTVTISDGPWAHGQTGYGGTNAATVWHQRWKQSGLTYTPSGGSATTLTDSGDMVLWLAQSATSNALTVNMAIDGIIYAMGGFKGNLNGQASTVARATFGDSGNGEHNANNIKSNGLWYYTSNGPATTLGASTGDGAIYSQAFSTSWAGQIAQDYRDGALFVRGLNSGTWKNWYAIPKFTTTTGGLGSTTQPVYIDTNGELQVCTAYGSASVNYAASSGSCTGNAATATKFKDNATNTTRVFYRGDNTWSNILKQTAASALGIDTNHKIGTAIKDLHFTVGSGSGTGINDGNAGGITIGTDTASYGGIYWQSSGSYGLRLHFATTGSFANGAYTRMLITSDGKVGIGTLTPDTLLTVNGNAKADKFIGALQGNADTATSAGKWTTARTLTIGNKGQSVDGSGNVSWSLTDIGAAPAVTGGYLPLSGGTLTGALNTANNTWNKIGDDAQLGDINKAGHIGIQGINGNTGIFFTTYNQTTKLTGGAITWDGTKFSITSTTAVDASISGNAATASALKDAGSNTSITAQYSGAGASATDWFTEWNGYKLVAVSSTDVANKIRDKASGSWGINISGTAATSTYLKCSDTRNAALNPTDLDAATGVRFDFKAKGTINLTATDPYAGVMSFRPYAHNTDWSGGPAHQIAFNSEGLHWRSGGASWDTWSQILDSNNTAAGANATANMTWGKTYTLAKINGTDIKITMPSNPNTDHYAWADITSKPDTATRWPTWSEVTGKPGTFAPSSHEHKRLQIIGRLNTAANMPYNPLNTQGAGQLSWCIYDQTSRNTDANGAPSFDAGVINLPWDWGGYNGQIAISNTVKDNTRMQIRSANHIDNGEGTNPRYSPNYGDWREVVTATKATKVGDTNKPVYINATGQATAISYTIEKSVPSNAVFTDHYAWGDITSKPDTATRWPKWNEIAAGADTLSEGTSNWTDNTEILTSYASNNGFADSAAKGVVYRRDALCAYNYIKGKLDSVYIAKTAGVTAVTWDATNKKLTRTINGTAADVMTAAQMSTALGLGSIATYTAATAGTKDTWGKVPVIGGTDGVMEVGKYIDFHTTDGNTADYDVRIAAATTGLTISGTTSGTFSGSLSGNATTATTASKLGSSNVGSARQAIYLSGGTATAGNYTVAHLGNAGKSNMNDVGRMWPSSGMTSLTSTSNADTPKNGDTYSSGWHLYWDTCYSDDPNASNAWVAQIVNKAGTSQWWVRSRSGSTITNGTAWASSWRHLVTSTEAAVGGATQPVYINTNGEVVACTALKALAYKDSLSASDVGALASTTKYAASSSVGGAATYATTTANTSDSIYPVGVKSGATTTLLHDTSITMKGGAISATTYTVNSHVTLQYNTTDSSLDFIFT